MEGATTQLPEAHEDPSGELERASSVEAACASATRWLWDRGMLATVYLCRGRRPENERITRYWQVADALPPGVEPRPACVTGRGRRQAVTIESAGRSVGLIDVGAQRDLAPESAEALESAARVLGTRIEQLGGPTEDSRPERLRHWARTLARLEDAKEVAREVVLAACHIADMESAVLTFPDDAELGQAVIGAHADELSRLRGNDVRRVRRWVDTMPHVYLRGDAGGYGFAGHDVLRDAGAETVVVLPIRAGRATDGVLVLTDSMDIALGNEDLAVLERWAKRAGDALQDASALRALEHTGDVDRLTGLATGSAFGEALSQAVAERRAFGLLVVDVDQLKRFNAIHGQGRGDEALAACAETVGRHLRERDTMFRCGGDQFAVMMSGADSVQALVVAEQMRAEIATLGGPTVSVGVAAAKPDEGQAELCARVVAALTRAKDSGRDRVAVE